MITRSFFSLPQVLDPAKHQAYNAWHQLDHRPENLALPGVVHGERWVRTPECREVSTRLGGVEDADLTGAQYAAMYWFREPAQASVDEWVELGQTSAEEGRRSELPYMRRCFNGHFRPLRGYVDPAVAITADALPFRPVRGVLLDVMEVEDPRSEESDTALRQLHLDVAEGVASTPGVIGAWTFASRSFIVVRPDDSTVSDSTRGRLEIVLRFCESDPVQIAADSGLPEIPSGLTPLLRTPLLTITPWEWDWFDATGSAEEVAR